MFGLIGTTFSFLGATQPGKDISIGEAFLVLLICMTVIMAVQLVLMLILYGFKYFSTKSKAAQQDKDVADAHQLHMQQEDDSDEEIAAVIAAATAIMLTPAAAVQEHNPVPFKIKNIKRIK